MPLRQSLNECCIMKILEGRGKDTSIYSAKSLAEPLTRHTLKQKLLFSLINIPFT